MTMKNRKPVLVLDTHRGIYFGYLKWHDSETKTVKLTNARHCYYFAKPGDENEGVYGLASVGPADGSKVGPRVKMTVADVSKVVEVTPAAVERWEAAKWGA